MLDAWRQAKLNAFWPLESSWEVLCPVWELKINVMVKELENLLAGRSHEGAGRDGSLTWGLIGRADRNVFMRTSLFLLLANQLRERLHLLHWLCLSLICSWQELVSFSRSELGHALSTGATGS